MWGALAGAFVGAFAAWLFALDLRRRESADSRRQRLQDEWDQLAELLIDCSEALVARPEAAAYLALRVHRRGVALAHLFGEGDDRDVLTVLTGAFPKPVDDHERVTLIAGEIFAWGHGRVNKERTIKRLQELRERPAGGNGSPQRPAAPPVTRRSPDAL